jgi:hypothetical protein
MVKITANLRNAQIHRQFNGDEFISGNVYGDTYDRWPDGTRINTSKIMGRDGDVFSTRPGHNYRVENWVSTDVVA